ncbi:MAG: nuclear transport factor 2 family protein [Lachnospiraceae bacterium]|nr:nuclear transport factor 2 family protein [Lachnospiraceae bacterium]
MDIKQKEIEMWEAAKCRDRITFLELVCTDAVMICGGFRCSGLEYSNIIKDFDLAEYVISDFKAVNETEDTCQVHYCIETFVEDTKNIDLQGQFHITSTWKKINGDWKLIFNMDSRRSGF